MCDEWRQNPDAFLEWVDNSDYTPDKTIERVDNNKGYSPDNCIWATKKQQANNRRSNHPLTYNGITKNLCEWADGLGINRSTLKMRIAAYGWSTQRALET